jgi:hypothetical protein
MRRSLALLAFVVPAICVAPATATTGSTGFTPKVLAGTWKGTWTNIRFKTTGPAYIRARVRGKNGRTLRFKSDFGGSVFGCGNPPAESGKITPGTGANHWNRRGFIYKHTSANFGHVKLTYRHRTKTITGGGKNPSCNPGLSWTIRGKFSGKRFSAKVHITLPDKSTATSVVKLKRRT